MTAISLTPDLTEVTMFGGAPTFASIQLDSAIQSVAATTIMMFGELIESMCSLCVRRGRDLYMM